MADEKNHKDELTAIEEALESAMAELNTTNTRIDGLLTGLDAGDSVEDAMESAEDGEAASSRDGGGSDAPDESAASE